MERFQQESIEPCHFQVEDVIGDNACFYRALANGLAYLSEGHTCDQVLKETDFNHCKSLEDFYDNDEWGFGGEEQDLLARELQERAYEWIAERPEDPVPVEGFEVSVSDLVEMIHNIPYETYVEIYQYFAGDLVIEEEEVEEEVGKKEGEKEGKRATEPQVGHTQKKRGDEAEFTILENRWGGYVEQLALSQCFHLPIIVLCAQKYDERREKMISGTIRSNKPIRGVRFRVYQTSGMEYLERGAFPVFLLWRRSRQGGDHYMAIYPKCMKKCLTQLQLVL